jgi:hypothetical protein
LNGSLAVCFSRLQGIIANRNDLLLQFRGACLERFELAAFGLADPSTVGLNPAFPAKTTVSVALVRLRTNGMVGVSAQYLIHCN